MAKNTIKVKSYLNIHREGVANAAITPGDLVEQMTTGKYRRHATAEGRCHVIVAMEDQYQGKGIEEDYSADNQVVLWVPTKGDRIYAHLDTGSASVSIGDFVVSAGNGHVTKAPTASAGALEHSIVGVAVEAASANSRVIIEVA